MIVMKFGGTSVGDCSAVDRLTKIVKGRSAQKAVVVVSALAGVTDTLEKIADLSLAGAADEAAALSAGLEKRHLSMTDELLAKNTILHKITVKSIQSLFSELNETIRVTVSSHPENVELVIAETVSYGELLSSGIIFRAMLNSGIRCNIADARTFIITDSNHLKGEPRKDLIKARVNELLKREFAANDVIITQGFISATAEGTGTTLGRGGSDYTAALTGMAADASEIQIWKDVNGVHTSDPGRVIKAKNISLISFSEAAELSFFGARVLHPATIQPAVEKNIPIRVLSSFDPESNGTLILSDSEVMESGVRAISFKENIIVINIFSLKMLNAFGFLTRLFEIFGKYGTPVDLISTSEVNVSLTIERDKNLKEITEEISSFAAVTVNRDKSQVSVVGRNLKETKGLAKRIFGSICDYNVTMISQGASDINVSFVVNRSDLGAVVDSLHKEFFE